MTLSILRQYGSRRIPRCYLYRFTPPKRPLKWGAQRLLGDHSRLSGKVSRRCYNALAEEFDLSSRLLQLEAFRVAMLWVNLDAASQALEAVRRARETGRGQRPTTRDVERASRRHGLADGSYSQALDRLRSIASPRKPPTLARLVQAIVDGDAPETVKQEIRKRERRRAEIERTLLARDQQANQAPPDVEQLRPRLLALLDDWKGLATRHVGQTRQLLRKLLVGRLRFATSCSIRPRRVG